MPESEMDTSEKNAPIEPYDFKNLPAHACHYCGIHEEGSVVKCQKCSKWFCNGKGAKDYGSHILWHMVKANHKEIQVHPESPLKDSPLECYLCGSLQKYVLTRVGQLVHQREDTSLHHFVVQRTMFEPDLAQPPQKDETHFDTSNWQPLIENKQLQTWLVAEPSAYEIQRSRQVTP